MKVTVMVVRIVMWAMGSDKDNVPPSPSILLNRERFLIPMAHCGSPVVVKVTYMVMGLVMFGQ